MERKAVSGIMLTLLLIGMYTLAFNIQQVEAEPTTWTVDDDGPADFPTIQQAINSAQVMDGDTIYVLNGTYHENVVVNKTVSLIGENKDATIIDGSGTTVKVVADNIVFKGFTTRVSGFLSVNIILNETVNTVIADNNIIGGGELSSGIRVYTSTNITLTGNNITGPGPGIVLSTSSHVLVAENNITKGSGGIGLFKSFNNTLTHNNLIEIRGSAIQLHESFNNTIAGNKITGWIHPVYGYSGVGIQLVAYPGENGSSYNTFRDNDIRNCGGALFIPYYRGGALHHNNVFLQNYMANNYGGVMLYHSFNFTFKDNILSENTYNLGVYGFDLLDYIHDIDASNRVNNKPVYYLTNQQNLTINPSTFPNVGYLALVNSTNITVENLNLNENSQGLLMVYTRNSMIIDNTITNNTNGIYLDILSSNNIVSGNNIKDQSWAGIQSEYSFNNTLIHNTVSNNGLGVRLIGSFNNTLSHNIIANNSRGGVWLDYSFNNLLVSNNIINNSAKVLSDAGVSLYLSYVNKIFHNNFINNQRQAYTCPGNFWDDGYPSGGNYWSDYTDVDEKNGPGQDLPGSDGIWDHPYEIDANNKDNYPLIEPWTPLPRTIGELKTEIEELGPQGEIDNQGIVKSLIAKLNVAQKLVDKGKTDEAVNVLEDFIMQVQELSGIHITVEAADILIKSAEYIMDHL